MKRLVLLAVIVVFMTFLSADAVAQSKTRVRFARGSHGATVKGTVRGFAYRDFIVGASAGQTIDLRMTATGLPSVFSVFLPNGENLESAAETDKFSGELPDSGDYVIRVGMMRSAARRPGSVSNFTLRISIK